MIIHNASVIYWFICIKAWIFLFSCYLQDTCYHCHGCYRCWCFHWPAKLLQVSAVCSDLGESASSFRQTVWACCPGFRCSLKANVLSLKSHGSWSSTAQPLHLCKLLFLGSTAEGMTVPGCYAMYPTARGAKWNSNNLCSMERVLQRPTNSCSLFAIPRTAGSISRSAWAAKCCLPLAVLAAM